MNKAEPLCDLRFLGAEYRLARPSDETPENFFDISIRPLAGTCVLYRGEERRTVRRRTRRSGSARSRKGNPCAC
jgi:hypothetical protein